MSIFAHLRYNIESTFSAMNNCLQRIMLLILLSVAGQSLCAQNNSVTTSCSVPGCSQFDFWVGEWDLTWGDTSKGTNAVKKMLDQWVVQESFKDPAGKFNGMSWSIYDPRKAEWKQTWVDNQGGYIVLTGKFLNDEMTLSTQPVVLPNGQRTVSRMVFYHILQDSFDWNWENSADEGKTWKLNWQIHYQRKK